MEPSVLTLALFFLAPAHGRAMPWSPDYDGNCQVPVWSPDGSKLSYEVNYHDRKSVELFVMTPGQGAPRSVRPVTRGASSITAGFSTSGAEMVVHEISWAPASIGKFVYSASGSDRDYDLYIDGGGSIARARGADGIEAGRHEVRHPADPPARLPGADAVGKPQRRRYDRHPADRGCEPALEAGNPLVYLPADRGGLRPSARFLAGHGRRTGRRGHRQQDLLHRQLHLPWL